MKLNREKVENYIPWVAPIVLTALALGWAYFSEDQVVDASLASETSRDRKCLRINNPDTRGTYDENLPIYRTAFALLQDLQPDGTVSVVNGDREEIVESDDYANEVLQTVWNGTLICDN